MRIASAVVAFLLLAACTVEEPGDPGGGDVDATGGGGSTDAAGTGSGSGSGNGGACDQPSTTLPFGNHNAGLACLGCHTGTDAAPRWTVAGTLFSSASGGAPTAGATVTITDANDVQLRLVTASNGNFYTGQALQMPLRVQASKCPDTRRMSGTPMTGDCNSCHQAATTGRIHLP